MDDKLVRARRSRLATSLRQFRLTDKFGLADLLDGKEIPSVEFFKARLLRYEELLPRGVGASYMAEVLRRDVVASEHGRASNDFLKEKMKVLQKLPAGEHDAGQYHDLSIEILGILFGDELILEKKEAPMGRKRIDILYRNANQGGFFTRVGIDHGIPCPYVPAECKNYSGDPKNPEFDQLAGRLNDRVGRFGILVCREVKDGAAMLERCRGYKDDKKSLIVLTDADLKRMTDQRIRGQVEDVLYQKLRQLLLA